MEHLVVRNKSTGLNTKGNRLNRNEASSQNSRAENISGQEKGSEPEVEKHSDLGSSSPDAPHVLPLRLSVLCIPPHPPLSTKQLSLSPISEGLLLQAYNWDWKIWAQRLSQEQETAAPRPGVPILLYSTEAKRPTQMLQICPPQEGLPSKEMPPKVSTTFTLHARPRWSKRKLLSKCKGSFTVAPQWWPSEQA